MKGQVIFLLLAAGCVFAQSNVFLSAYSSGTVEVLEISGYDTSLGRNTVLPDLPYNECLDCDCSVIWQPTGSFCSLTDPNDPDVLTSFQANQGATWYNEHEEPYGNYDFDGTLVGTLVFDTGVDVTITDLSVFQMFSDGKVTSISLLYLPAGVPSGANLFQDPNWVEVFPDSPVGPGSSDSSEEIISDPTYFNFPAVTGRYFLVEARNDGTYGDEEYIEIGGIKAFNFGFVGGDPHVFGFDGSELDLIGDQSDVFNVVTSTKLQVNMRLVTYEKLSSLYRSFVGALAFTTSSGDTVLLEAGGSTTAASVTINGETVLASDFTRTDGASFSVRSSTHARIPDENMARWHTVSSVVIAEFEGYSFYVSFIDPDSRLYGHSRFIDFEAAQHDHGLLGRTAHTGNERADEGAPGDFLVKDGLFGSDFRFNRF